MPGCLYSPSSQREAVRSFRLSGPLSHEFLCKVRWTLYVANLIPAFDCRVCLAERRHRFGESRQLSISSTICFMLLSFIARAINLLRSEWLSINANHACFSLAPFAPSSSFLFRPSPLYNDNHTVHSTGTSELWSYALSTYSATSLFRPLPACHILRGHW